MFRVGIREFVCVPKMDICRFMAGPINFRAKQTGATSSIFTSFFHGDNGAGIGVSQGRVNQELTGACFFARLSDNKTMIVTTEYADISMPGSPMRTFVAAPKAEGRHPGIWCFSDIFQLTPPMLRTCVRLAGYGFVAAAPEIYRSIEPPGNGDSI